VTAVLRRLPIGFWQGWARQSWLPWGLRDRALRAAWPPAQGIDHPFEEACDAGRFAGNLDNFVDWSIFFYGAYEQGLLNLLRNVARRSPPEDQVFWDIGANVGQHSVGVSPYVRETHSFEPFPPVRQRLQCNVALNPDRKIVVHPYGLSDKAAELPFYGPSSINLGGGTFDPNDDMSDKTPAGVLPLCAGDDLVDAGAAPAPTLIKMDIQGFEPMALAGLRRSIEAQRPVIACEYTDLSRDNGGPDHGVGWLRAAGYEFYGMGGTPERLKLFAIPEGTGVGTLDLLFVPREKRSKVAGLD
jgi:FkbM family methyltransferase